MSGITTHILDTSLGRPAAGVSVTLERQTTNWQIVANGQTDEDGRLRLVDSLLESGHGDYRLSFETGAYFEAIKVESFYPSVVITFTVKDSSAHHHVPLLLSPYGFSTYRGS